MRGAGDLAVWDYALQHGLTLVTKDQDFHVLSVLRGYPPKVICIRLGNCSTGDIISLLKKRAGEIQEFAEHPEAAFLALA